MFRRRLYLWLPALGGCLLAGGLLGVQLGQSAIAGINPIHFRGAAPPPQPAQPPPRAASGAVYADGYGWPEGIAARAAECGNCVLSPETYAFVETPTVQRLTGPVTAAAVQPEPAAEIREREPIEREVIRYTDYPIEDGRDEAKPDKPSAYWENDVYED